MICDGCSNSNKIKTGVPSCSLPHCTKSRTALAKRFAELYWKPKYEGRTAEEEAEFQMLKAELKL